MQVFSHSFAHLLLLPFHTWWIAISSPISQCSWSRVNNPAGVAKILTASVDEKGKQVYDIKYVVGRSTHREVLHKYLSPNSF